jgi:hypothetical protein
VSLAHGFNTNLVRKWIRAYQAQQAAGAGKLVPVTVREAHEAAPARRSRAEPASPAASGSIEIELSAAKVIVRGPVNAGELPDPRTRRQRDQAHGAQAAGASGFEGPDLTSLRGFFFVSINEPILRRLLVLIFLIVPRHSCTDLVQTNVAQVDEHRADLAAVPVLLVAVGFDSLLEYERR